MANKNRKSFKDKDEWQQWFDDHQSLVDATGLPPLYFSTEEHWGYYLDHGSLFRFEEDGPEFYPASLLQRSALVRLFFLRGDLDSCTGQEALIGLLEHIDSLPRKK